MFRIRYNGSQDQPCGPCEDKFGDKYMWDGFWDGEQASKIAWEKTKRYCSKRIHDSRLSVSHHNRNHLTGSDTLNYRCYFNWLLPMKFWLTFNAGACFRLEPDPRASYGYRSWPQATPKSFSALPTGPHKKRNSQTNEKKRANKICIILIKV